MRQLMLMFLFTTFLSSPSMAKSGLDFSSTTLMEMKSSSTFAEKYKHLQKLLARVQSSLDNIDHPEDLLTLPDNNPIVENFRSLNELEGYIEQLLKTTKSKKSCQKTKENLMVSPTNLEETDLRQLPELKVSVDLLEELCK